MREPGDYAVRGGIIDLYPPGMAEPVRLDFFGDTLETIRSFDAETQRIDGYAARARSGAGRGIPAHHRDHPPLPHRLCRGVRRRAPNDPLYEAVSEGRRHPGMEHWLPLFHDQLDTLFDYLPGAAIVLEPLAEDAAHERFAQIADYYEARAARRSKPTAPARSTSRCRRSGSISAKTEWKALLEAARWRG